MPENVSEKIRQLLIQIQDFAQKTIDSTQVIALVVIALISWILQLIIRRALKTLEAYLPPEPWPDKLLVVLYKITLPLTVLALTSLVAAIFNAARQNTDLIELAGRLIWVWLGYRLLAALLEVSLNSERARFWSRKVLLPLFVVIGALSAFGVLDNVLAWGIYINSLNWSLTIGSILLAAGVVVIFYVLSHWARNALAKSFLPEAGLEPTRINTISKIISYTIIATGVFVALSAIGIDLTSLAVILGGLSVGLAFGLQDIVNNFVSGFIILIERSIEIGNVVEVDNNVGVVQKVGVRSSIIKTRDNVELIIPNSYFLTEIVTNMTHSEDLVRTRISVGVTYKATPREVEQALLEVAARHSQVLAQPAPSVQFKDFGESSLNFELLVWTNRAIETPLLTSDLRFGIWDALATRNIEIPFPQRDIHIRSGGSWSELTQSTRRSS